MGFLNDVADGAVNVGERVIDVPADAINATTGTGENLGWFGKIDRALDPRAIANDEWAEPSPENDGLSGFFRGGIGATTGLARQTGNVTADPLFAFLGLDGLTSPAGSQPGDSSPPGSPPDNSDDDSNNGGGNVMLVVVAAVAGLAAFILME